MTKEEKKFVYVFDLDNTLIKTNMANNLSYKEAIKDVAGVDVSVNAKHRITKDSLRKYLKDIPQAVINRVVAEKDSCFAKYIDKTVLNVNLFRLLKVLSECGKETILLTNSRKKRALQLCCHYDICRCFTNMFFYEDYTGSKYDFLKTNGYNLSSVVLFENEDEGKMSAVSAGIMRNNVIRVKF